MAIDEPRFEQRIGQGGGNPNMKIEAVSKASGLNGGREVWVRVLSNEVLDWPSVERRLDEEQLAMLADLGKKAMSYFPHSPIPEERDEHGYLCDDFWVWAAA